MGAMVKRYRPGMLHAGLVIQNEMPKVPESAKSATPPLSEA